MIFSKHSELRMEYNSSGAIHWSINKQFMVILIADIKNIEKH